MDDAIEPLIPSLWFERIEKIARGQLGKEENTLRHAAHLLQLAPTVYRHALRLGADHTEFEALLDAGSFDAAARHLVARPTALSVQFDGDIVEYRATMGCPILGCAISGSGKTEAWAILDAWTACLLNLRSEFGTQMLSQSRQRAHRSPAG